MPSADKTSNRPRFKTLPSSPVQASTKLNGHSKFFGISIDSLPGGVETRSANGRKFFVHPDLPGKEYSEKQIGIAGRILDDARNAEERGDEFNGSTPVRKKILDALASSNLFQQAIIEKNERLQMRLVLEEADPSIKSLGDKLILLNREEKDFLASVLVINGPACSHIELDSFMNMHPGIRDLRARNLVSSMWTKGDFRVDIERLRQVRRSLYEKCGIGDATPDEKLQAVSDPGNLSPMQRLFISRYLGYTNGSGAIDFGHVLLFRNWLMSNPLQAETYWKKGKTDVQALAGVAHLLRFRPGATPSPEQVRLLAKITGEDTFDETRLDELAKIFMRKLNSRDDKTYFPEILALPLALDDPSPEALLANAQRHSEFNTMLGFFGLEAKEVVASELRYHDGLSTPKHEKGTYKKYNEDAYSSIKVGYSDGSTAYLKCVADGMGGHDLGKGASGLTNGTFAANIAKTVFEISALSGWVLDAEDLRKVFILADLAILMEQLGRKSRGSDGSFTNPERECDMGTTMVASLRTGSHIFCVNAGDSEYALIRDGQVMFQSTSHNGITEFIRNGKDISQFSDEVRRNFARSVTSALGDEPTYVEINNAYSGSPIEARPGDIEVLTSDGMNEPICYHEIPIVIKKNNGDMQAALIELVSIAETRNKRAMFETLCECLHREGKNDDRTIILGRV